MGATKTRAGANGRRSDAPRLPAIRVARFREAVALLDRLVEEKTDVFLGAAQRFRQRHHEATSRALTAVEAVQIASGILGETDQLATAEKVQASELRGYEDPQPQEVLVAAGMATAPAFMDAATRLVALLELPDDVFRQAREDETLDEAIDARVKELDELPMPEARARARAALDHLAKAAGASSSGEAWGLLTRTVGQAFSHAMVAFAPILQGAEHVSLTGSLPNTDGQSTPSSMTSDGAQQ